MGSAENLHSMPYVRPRPKFADESFYNYQCGVEHANSTSMHGYRETGKDYQVRKSSANRYRRHCRSAGGSSDRRIVGVCDPGDEAKEN
jgi:hypothetical protein